MQRVTASLLALCLISGAAAAQSMPSASAKLEDTNGNRVGSVELKQTANQGVWLAVKIDKLPPGEHAFHIHETGKCAGDFKSAGGHYAPEGHKHGVLVEGGPHAGDIPNLHVPADGKLTVEIFAPNVSLKKGVANTLFDDDGSSFIVHEGADDYKSQPSGAAGDRIACGVISEGSSDRASLDQPTSE